MRIFLLLIFLPLSTFAQELCPKSLAEDPLLEECLANGINIVSQTSSQDDTPESALASAILFMDQYKDRVDFDRSSAESIVKKLEKYSEDESLPAKQRSRMLTFASGIHGRLSDKLRMNGGREAGKKAIDCLKKSLALDKTNTQSAIGYATTISNLSKKNRVGRIFIEAGLGIKLSDEVKSAIGALEAANLKDHELYQTLLSLESR